MYLSDVDEGGHTIFPLCHGGRHLVPGSVDADINASLAEAIQSLWGGYQQGFSRHVDFDYKDDHPFNDVFSAAVRWNENIDIGTRSTGGILRANDISDIIIQAFAA